MRTHEDNARVVDLFTTPERPFGNDADTDTENSWPCDPPGGPAPVLIAACVFSMVYTGGFFDGVDFISAFAGCNASMSLVMGSSIALMFTFVFYQVRGVMSFEDFAAASRKASKPWSAPC